MTVQEAKEVIEDFDKCVTVKADGCYETIDYIKAKEIAIESMKEVEQYRALGTVEELKEAREKQVAKKPIMKTVVFCDEAEDAYVCSACEGESLLFEGQPYCENCGQAIDWSEEDE